MKEKRIALCSRIRSAKSWLNRAEDSFVNKNDVQGEINLLLAQAELKHLQEKEQFSFTKYRHMMAIFTAVFITFSVWGLGSFYFAKPQPVSSVNQNANYFSTVSQSTGLIGDQSYFDNSGLTEITPLAGSEVVEAVLIPKTLEVPQPVKENISEREMRELIRTAGSVLRSNVQ